MNDYIVKHEKSGVLKSAVTKLVAGIAGLIFSYFFFKVIGGYIGAGGGGACIGLGVMLILLSFFTFLRSSRVEHLTEPLIKANGEALTFTLPSSDFSPSPSEETATIPFSNIIKIEGKKQGMANNILLYLHDKDSFYNSLSEKAKKNQVALSKPVKSDAIISLESSTQDAREIAENLQKFL